ncbi:hypothetical protein BJQ90_02711 [Arthrobacter sp. SO3]|nr:hypothetical protein [Arthrobacter sp. SO3]
MSDLLYTCTRYPGAFATGFHETAIEPEPVTVAFSPVGTVYKGVEPAVVVAVTAAEYAVSDVSPSALIPRTRNL